MIEELSELYVQAGEWGDPLLLTTAALFFAGWIMLFTVRVVKRFVLFSVVALILPNSIGLAGYLDSLEDLEEAVLERADELSETALDSADDVASSPLYLGLICSLLTLLPGLIGLAKARRASTSPPSERAP